MVEQSDPRTRVKRRAARPSGGARRVLGRSNQGIPDLTTSAACEAGRSILSSSASQKGYLAVEHRPQQDATRHVVFSQTKDQARHAVGTDDALITVNGKQHGWGILVARDRGNIPRMT